MSDGFGGYGIDELYRMLEEADRRGRNDLVKSIDEELKQRKGDIDDYNDRQAEVRFGA